MAEPDFPNPWDTARQNINARASEMWYNSPLRRGIAATGKAIDSAGETLNGYAKSAYDKLAGPEFVGPPDPYEISPLQRLLVQLGLASEPVRPNTAGLPVPKPLPMPKKKPTSRSKLVDSLVE